jgi:hypothetical protein
MCFLQIRLFVYSQIWTWKLSIRMPVNQKSWKNKKSACFPHTASLANASNTVIMWMIILIAFCSVTKVTELCMLCRQTVITHCLSSITTYIQDVHMKCILFYCDIVHELKSRGMKTKHILVGYMIKFIIRATWVSISFHLNCCTHIC